MPELLRSGHRSYPIQDETPGLLGFPAARSQRVKAAAI